jgi:hypothetical protein
MSFVGKWVELETMMLNKVSQVHKGHMFSLICRIQTWYMHVCITVTVIVALFGDEERKSDGVSNSRTHCVCVWRLHKEAPWKLGREGWGKEHERELVWSKYNICKIRQWKPFIPLIHTGNNFKKRHYRMRAMAALPAPFLSMVSFSGCWLANAGKWLGWEGIWRVPCWSPSEKAFAFFPY